MNKEISNRIVFALMVIAFAVFLGQVFHLNCWLVICLYWLVLTIKNYFDWRGKND